MSVVLMSDHPNCFCCKDKMVEGVVHKTRYKIGFRTYVLHTFQEPSFPYALHTFRATALNLGRLLFPARGITGYHYIGSVSEE
jgi:hypothetical protein